MSLKPEKVCDERLDRLTDGMDFIVQAVRNARETLERVAEESGLRRGTRAWCVNVEANPLSVAAQENVHEVDGICIWCGRREHDDD